VYRGRYSTKGYCCRCYEATNSSTCMMGLLACVLPACPHTRERFHRSRSIVSAINDCYEEVTSGRAEGRQINLAPPPLPDIWVWRQVSDQVRPTDNFCMLSTDLKNKKQKNSVHEFIFLIFSLSLISPPSG